ncbi:hypothetical protein AB0L05_32840 [Nonomuraea pusilla]|uniref:hypothetical protein n=1 Tax=Nonomuraea pusilla TaxID=46177 RepID=UPI00333462D0
MGFTDIRYDLYGLPSGNPYSGRPLDPLASEADRALLLELEGFIGLAAIERAVERAVSEQRPAFFLITGVGNSGRTSLANHIMYLYRRAAAARLTGYAFVTHCADRRDMTHDAYGLLRSTLLWLRNRMVSHNVDIPANLHALFVELSRRARGEPMNEYDLQQIAEYAAVAMKAHDTGFGIRYEGVSTKDLLTLGTMVFENIATVVVFTVDAYAHAGTVQLTETDRQEFARRGQVFDLDTLTPRQIAALAHGRWNGCPPAPFEPQGVQRAFEGETYTVGEALRHLATLLDIRLSEYDEDTPWPNDDLRIHEEWLRLKIWQARKWNGLGGFRG